MEVSEGNDRVSCEEEPVLLSHPLATREEEDVLVHQSISGAFNPLLYCRTGRGLAQARNMQLKFSYT